jgi:hypothetical protein
MRQLATTHLAKARVGTGALACAAAAMCAAACSARTTKPRQASTISPPHLSSAPDTTTRRRSGTPPRAGHPMQNALHAEMRPPCRSQPMQIATHADRNPCRSQPMQIATHADHDSCRSRLMQNATHADRDSKAYASVASTTTPAPKGRNSLAQGVSPGTAPAKSRAPEGRQPVHPPTSTSSPHPNIDTHKYRYPSI